MLVHPPLVDTSFLGQRKAFGPITFSSFLGESYENEWGYEQVSGKSLLRLSDACHDDYTVDVVS